MSSGLNGLTRHDYLRLHEVIVGSEYKRRNDKRYHYHNGANGGNLVNSILDDFGTEGGIVKTDCLIHVDDEDINFEACNGGLILQGTGHFNMTDNPATYFTSYAKSGFYFDGFHFTSALAAVRRGRITIRDMSLGFRGITSDHLIPSDYIYYTLDGLLIQEWSNTFATGDGILGPIDAAPTPTSQKGIIKDCSFQMRSENCVALGPHYENLNVIRPVFSFQGVNQVGVSIKGVGLQSIYSPLIWLGAPANSCAVFEIYNSIKYCSIYDISGSHQAGGVVAPCSLFGTYPGTWTNTQINATAWNINGDVEWLQEAAAADFAVWEDDDAQERVLILGQVEGIYVPSYRQIAFLTERAAVVHGTPGVAYVALDADLTTTINLNYTQHARICGKAQGDEAGDAKGVCIYNITDGEVLCEHIWNGAAVEEFEGPWKNVEQVGATQLNVYDKASSATENMSIWKVWIELR